MIDRSELQPFLDQLLLNGPVEPFLVLSDWLQDRGDPWGELIAMQCQEPDDHERKRTFALASHSLLERLADQLCPHDPLVGIAWKRGFVSTIAFSDSDGPGWMGDELVQLFGAPAAALCTELSLAGAHIGDDHVGALLRVRPRLLAISRLDLRRNWFSRAVVAELRDAFPTAVLDDQRSDDDAEQDRGAIVRSWGNQPDD